MPDGPARRRGAPAAADDRQRGVQRGVLRRRAHRARRTCSARSARAGRSRWRRSASSAAPRSSRSSSRFEHELCELHRRSRTSAAPAHDPVIRDELADSLRRRADHEVQRHAHAHEPGEERVSLGPGGEHRQAVLDAPGTARFGETRDGRARAPTGCDRRAGRGGGAYELDELHRIFMAAARRPSTPARARSNATSSVSGCSGSRANPAETGRQRGQRELRLLRGARTAARRRPAVPGGQVAARRRCAGSWRRPRATTPRCGSRWARSSGSRASHIPEEYGGQGFTFVELGIVLEEMGRVLLCAPYFSTVVLAANAILERRHRRRRRRQLLPGIASGETIAALAFTEPNGKWDAAGITMEAQRRRATRTRSTATKMFVIDGHTADHDRRRGARRGHDRRPTASAFFTVDGDADGLTRTPLATMDQTRKQAQARVRQRRRRRRSATPGTGWAALLEDARPGRGRRSPTR